MSTFLIKQHEPRTLKEWFANMDQIDLNPGFQRRSALWGAPKQIKLIDTVLNGYDVPKLYVADYRSYGSKDRESNLDYAVIDGKQRLETFFRFFNNDLVLRRKDCRIVDEEDVDLEGYTYATLAKLYPHLAARVDNYELAVMSVLAGDRARVRDLFVRLNYGVPVNGAERRNAMLGIVPGLIHRLATHSFFADCIKFNVSRMAEYNVAAKLLLLEYRGRFVDIKARNLDDLVYEGEARETKEIAEACDRTVAILDRLERVFFERDRLLSAGGAVPVYYWIARENASLLDDLRSFLSVFLKDLKENLELQRDDPESADPELSNYYTMARTTNDQASLAGRYAILRKRLRKFASKE